MTDFRLTQAAIEEWAKVTPPNENVTQVAVEEWVTTNVTNPAMVVTQVAVEQWAPWSTSQAYALSVDPGSYSLHGAAHSLYGMGLYGMGRYSGAMWSAVLGVGMPGAQGAYALSGFPAALVQHGAGHYALAAAGGVYTLTGFPAAFVRPLNYRLSADRGVYLLDGKTIELVKAGSHPGVSVSPIPYRLVGFPPFMVKGRAPLHPPVKPPTPTLREATYRIRGLGRGYDPTITIVKDRPGPMRIVEIDAWMN